MPRLRILVFLAALMTVSVAAGPLMAQASEPQNTVAAETVAAPLATPQTPAARATGATAASGGVQTSEILRTALVLTLAAVLPAFVICMTPFIRIAVVLSMIRHALGVPETPPTPVLLSLTLILTALIMAPTLSTIQRTALGPFMEGSISVQDGLQRGAEPLRDFMLRQVRDKEIASVYAMAKRPLPATAKDVGMMELTTAFILNELRVSFKIAFVIFLPFLVIDIVVSSILISLGMLMVPPSTISLPLKVLMFVLIDGWGLVLENVVSSFK